MTHLICSLSLKGLSLSLPQPSFTSITANGQWPETSLPSYNGWFRLAASVYMLDGGTSTWALRGWWFVRSCVAVQWGRILAGRLESQESSVSCWRHHIFRQMCVCVCLLLPGLQCHGSCTNNFLPDLKMSFGLHHPSIRCSSSLSPPPRLARPSLKALHSLFYSSLPCYINCPMLFSFRENAISFQAKSDSAKESLDGH